MLHDYRILGAVLAGLAWGTAHGAAKDDEKVMPWQESMQKIKETFTPIRKAVTGEGQNLGAMAKKAELVLNELKSLPALYKSAPKEAESAAKVLAQWQDFESLNTTAIANAEAMVKALTGDGAAAKTAVETMNENCKECHKKFR